MSNPPLIPLSSDKSSAKTAQSLSSHLPLNKTRLAVLLGGVVLASGIFTTLGFRSAPSEPAAAKLFVPERQSLQVIQPEKAIEGQPYELRLNWQHLPVEAQVATQTLSLRWQDVSYTGSVIKPVKTVSLGQQATNAKLIFESPGTHTVDVLGPDGAVWKSLNIKVEPYQASVYPAHWDKNRILPQAPERYHIYVNLHYDAKNPKTTQRQYLQITQDGRILERLLVSSGALANMTPLGKFKLGFKDYYPRSARYNNTPMPFWSAIDVPGHPGEFGFHSLEDGGYQYLLGRPASHGCIRMSRLPSVEKDPKTGKPMWGDRGGARWIYDRIPEGTPITMFRHQLQAFSFEDLEHWQIRQAREYQAAQQAKAKVKASAKVSANTGSKPL